ncbi:hypothetical protein [Streptomyces hokutonensis]|nr:hypothetical protein [Streptomyces hokutonensis]
MRRLRDGLSWQGRIDMRPVIPAFAFFLPGGVVCGARDPKSR